VRVLICGDRRWGDWDHREGHYLNTLEVEAVRQVVATLPRGTVIIEGEARGADQLAAMMGRERRGERLVIEPYPADWETYGRAAGPVRNRQMLAEGNPEVCVYFHRDLAASKGTADMVKRCKLAGVPVYSWEEWLAR
jgi:hypothetical protein